MTGMKGTSSLSVNNAIKILYRMPRPTTNATKVRSAVIVGMEKLTAVNNLRSAIPPFPSSDSSMPYAIKSPTTATLKLAMPSIAQTIKIPVVSIDGILCEVKISIIDIMNNAKKRKIKIGSIILLPP